MNKRTWTSYLRLDQAFTLFSFQFFYAFSTPRFFFIRFPLPSSDDFGVVWSIGAVGTAGAVGVVGAAGAVLDGVAPSAPWTA